MRNWWEDNMIAGAADAAPEQPWQLRLYVAGTSARSARALANLRGCCEAHLPGQYSLEVIDVQEFPAIARRDQVVALPLLVRCLPSPRQCLIGDLSDPERLLQSLMVSLPC